MENKRIKYPLIKKYIVAIILGIICTIISLPLSYKDMRPVDGHLTIGFPFTVRSIYSGYGCVGISKCTQPRISYVGIILNIIFFSLIIIFIHNLYNSFAKERRKVNRGWIKFR